jgi:signal transduction histidine kinase/Tfp pilus assembly protein PilF
VCLNTTQQDFRMLKFKQCRLIFLFVFFVYQTSAQNLTIDSLRHKINNAADDTVKVNLTLSMANEFFWSGQYEKALEVATQGMKLARQLDFKKGEGQALIVCGQSNIRLGNYDNAFQFFSDAVSIFTALDLPREKASSHLYLGQVYDFKAFYPKALDEYAIAKEMAIKSNDQVTLTKILNSTGITYFNKGDYEAALENYLTALKTTPPAGNEKVYATVLNNIGVVNLQLTQYAEALKYFLLYVDAMKRLKGTHGLGVGYMNVGEAYMKLGDRMKAIENFTEASRIQSETGDKKGMALSFSNMGDVYKALNNYKKASDVYKHSIDLARQIKNDEVLLNPLIGAADLYIKSRSYGEAQQTIEEARAIASLIGSKSWLERAYLTSSKLDSARGDYHQAYSWFKKYSVLKDSLLDEQKSRQIIQMKELYESEKKDKEIRLLSETNKLAEVQRANTKKLFTVYVMFLSVIIVIILYWLLHKTRHSKILKLQKEEISNANKELKLLLEKIAVQNDVLAEKNENLKELHREKDALIGVVVHDLRSPLNRILGLSQLVGLSGDLNDQQKFIMDNMNRVCHDGNRLIGDLLEMNEYETSEHIEFSTIAIIPFLESHLKQYVALSNAKNIQMEFNVTADNRIAVKTNGDYLKRIIDNLVTNAIKFSQPDSRIWVNLLLDGDAVALTVRDEGPGFTPEDLTQLFQKFKKLSARPTAGESSTGLGLSIVKILADKLKASIKVESKQGDGATFVIRLPLATEIVVA